MGDLTSWLNEDEEDSEVAPNLSAFGETRTPDQVGADLSVADRVGQPPQAVQAYRDVFSQAAERAAIQQQTERTPRLRQWLDSAPDNYAIARDDVENLSAFERQPGILRNITTFSNSVAPMALLFSSADRFRRAWVARHDDASSPPPERPPSLVRDITTLHDIAVPRSEEELAENLAYFAGRARPLGTIGEANRQGQYDTELNALGFRRLQAEGGFADPLTDAEAARLAELNERPNQDEWGPFIVGPVARMFPQLVGQVQSAGAGLVAGAREGWAQGADSEVDWSASPLERAGTNITGGVLGSYGAVVGGVGGGFGGYVGYNFAQESGSLYNSLRNEGIDPEIARSRAIEYGYWSAALEFAGDYAFMGLSGAAKLAARTVFREAALSAPRPLLGAAGSIGAGAGTEGLTESSQEVATIIQEDLARQEQAGDAPETMRAWRQALTPENIQRILHAGYIGAQAGGGMASVPAGANLALDLNAAAQAERNAQRWENMTRAAQASRVGQRHPASLEAAVSAMDDSDVYIDADRFVEFFQTTANKDPFSAAQELGISQETLTQALAAHGAIQIPTARFAARVLRAPDLAPLAQHVRANPGDATPAEVETIRASFQAEVERIVQDAETQAKDSEIGQMVEARMRDLFASTEQEGGPRPEISRRYARLVAAMPRALLARARASGNEDYANRLEAGLRTLFGENLDIAGPNRDWSAASGAEMEQRRGEGAYRGSAPFHDERLTPTENKVVEMALNNYSNAEIAEEMGHSPRTTTALLIRAKAKIPGLDIEQGFKGQPGVNPQTREATATIEEIVALHDKLLAAGYTNERRGRSVGAGESINQIIAQRLNLSPGTVKARLSQHRRKLREAEAEAVRAPEPQSAMAQRREWVDTFVARHQAPGEGRGAYQHGFKLSSGRRMHVGIIDDGNGAANIDWTFLERLERGGDDVSALYGDGPEKLTASEWLELRTAIQAIVEADVAKHARPAYTFTPQRTSNRRANIKMLEELNGLGYDLREEAGSVYLFNPGAGIANNGRIKPQGGWTPNFEELVEHGSQEEADDAQQAYYAAVRAQDVSAIGPALRNVAEATRRERQEAARSRAAAESLAGRPERGTDGGGSDGDLNQSASSGGVGGPPFYSALERAIQESRTNSAPGAQWWATLSKTPGVKKEELQWLGLEDFLKAQEGQVARESVLAFVRANGVTVEETVLGDSARGVLPPLFSPEEQQQRLQLIEERDRLENERSRLSTAYEGWKPLSHLARDMGFERDYLDNPEVNAAFDAQPGRAIFREIDARLAEIQPEIARFDRLEGERARERRLGLANQQTRWSQYTLPGGNNYRELLLRLPEESRELRALMDEHERLQDEFAGLNKNLQSARASAIIARLKEIDAAAAPIGKPFRSSHFAQPNILAHVRFNERVDAAGKRTLFIEEVQSDWHQAGRERGYHEEGAELPGGWSIRQSEGGRWSVSDASGATIAAGATREEAISRSRQPTRRGAVPDAPFKNNAWAALALKRMIRWAAENGFDQIAWTRGQVQIERFNLAKFIDDLALVEDTNMRGEPLGRRLLTARKDGRQVFEREITDDAQIAEYVGKEAAQQLLEAPNKGGERRLSGIDLQTGGEGMRAFYDRILPNIANDLGKKFGARVGEADIDTRSPLSGRRWQLQRADGTTYNEFATRQDAERNAKAGEVVVDTGEPHNETVHSLPIPPEMREAAMAGQPLFQNEARGSIRYQNFRVGEFGSAIIRMGGAADLSTFLHEFGHLGHLVLESIAADPQAPAEFKQMWEATLQWWGVDQAQWDALDSSGRVDHYERWARTFEAYLMEGKAPSLSLREAFAAFKAWLTQIYRTIFRLDANLNPQIRDVFDRLLATDAEMAEARAASGSDFALAREAFKTDEEFAQYQQAIQAEKEAAEGELRARVMDSVARKNKRWWRSERERVRPTAEIEVDSDPARRAFEWLALGEWRAPGQQTDEEGRPIAPDPALAMPEGLPAMRLDWASLDEADRAGLPEALRPLVSDADVDAALDSAMALKRQGRVKQPQRLWAFIKAQGGINDRGGEITQALGSGRARPGLINNVSGLDPDELALRAWEAGYFGATPSKGTIAELRQDRDETPPPRANFVLPTDPSEWRSVINTHPWIDSPSRAQLVIMASARDANGKFLYSNDDISRVTRLNSISSALTFARNAGVEIPSRISGRGGPTKPRGGERLESIIEVMESAARNGERLTTSQISQRLGISEQNVRTVLSQARNTSGRRPSETLLARLRTLDAARNMVRKRAGPDAGELFQEDGELYSGGDRRPTPQELIDALIDDLKNVRQVYSSRDGDALAAYQNRSDALRWFESRGIDLSGSKEEIRAQLVEALANEQAQENAFHPDDIAPWFGFSSGDEMLQALKALKPRNKAIEENIDARLDGEYGDPLRDGTVAEEARLAAHAEAQMRRIEIELEAIQRATGGRSTPVGRAARAYAERQVQSMTVRQLRNHETFLAGERRAARNAFDLINKGKPEEAAIWKQRQLISAHLYRFARDASEEMDSAQRYFQKFDRDTIRAKIHAPLLDQIDQALEGIDLRAKPRISNRRRQSFVAWYQEMQAEGLEHLVVADADFLDAVKQRPFATLTLEEARAIRDAVKNFEHIGRRWREVLGARDARLLDEAVAEMTANMADVRAIAVSNPNDHSPGVVESLDRGRQGAHAQLSRVEFLARAMDRQQDNGPVWNGLFRPLTEARDREEVRQHQAMDTVQTLFAVYSAKERADMWTVRRFYPQVFNRFTGKPGMNFTKQEILSIALNTGNEYNFKALADGFQWSPDQVRALLDAAMDGRDWAFVQSVWDYVDSFYPEIEQLYLKSAGVAPAKVQATPFQNRHGEWRGGYWPAVYDHRGDARVREELEQSEVQQAFGGFRMRTQTPNSFAKARQGSGGRPVRLDLSILSEHVNGVIHDLEFRLPVLNAWRLIKHGQFREAFSAAAGEAHYNELKPWLQYVATERMPPERGFASVLRLLRRNTPIALMGYAISTVAQQPGGLLGAAHRVGGGRIIGKLLQLNANPFAWIETSRFINARSVMMRHRTMISQREIREMMQEINADGHIDAVNLIFAGNARQKAQGLAHLHRMFQRYALYPLAFVDKQVSSIVWMAAYERAMAGEVKNIDPVNEKDVIAYADQVIRTTFGAGRPEDLSPIMRSSEIGKMITPAFGYFSVQYNQLYNEQAPGLMRGHISPLEFTTFIVSALVLQALVSEWAAGRWEPDDDEDEEDRNARLGIAVATTPVAGIPIIRDMARAVARTATTGDPSQFSTVPAIGAISATASGVGGAAHDLYEEGAIDRATARDLTMAGGYWFGYPGRQAWTTGSYISDWASGAEDPTEDPADAASEAFLRDTR